MALIDQEGKGRKEKGEDSFIINFIKLLFATYVIATTLHYFARLLNKVILFDNVHKILVNILLETT
jgi:hypothetical protein